MRVFIFLLILLASQSARATSVPNADSTVYPPWAGYPLNSDCPTPFSVNIPGNSGYNAALPLYSCVAPSQVSNTGYGGLWSPGGPGQWTMTERALIPMSPPDFQTYNRTSSKNNASIVTYDTVYDSSQVTTGTTEYSQQYAPKQIPLYRWPSTLQPAYTETSVDKTNVQGAKDITSALSGEAGRGIACMTRTDPVYPAINDVACSNDFYTIMADYGYYPAYNAAPDDSTSRVIVATGEIIAACNTNELLCYVGSAGLSQAIKDAQAYIIANPSYTGPSYYTP